MGDTRKARLMRRSSLAQLALDGTTVDLSIFFLDESEHGDPKGRESRGKDRELAESYRKDDNNNNTATVAGAGGSGWERDESGASGGGGKKVSVTVAAPNSTSVGSSSSGSSKEEGDVPLNAARRLVSF